jgi:hypothetical protein
MCLDMRRYQKLHDSRTVTKNFEGKRFRLDDNLPLIHNFLHKHVKVKVGRGLTVEGILVHHQNADKSKHIPAVLVLKRGSDYHILRGNFENISEVKQENV